MFRELVNVFCRVPSSSVLPAVPSDPALKGSSADPSSELSGEVAPINCGDAGVRDGVKNSFGMPCPPSNVAEWGDMIRTVLTVFDLWGREISKLEH